MDKLLITGTDAVTLEPGRSPIAGADVLVVDGRIAAVGPDAGRGVDAERIDGSGTVAIPGFVDTHRHTFQTVLRGVLAGGTLEDYFGTVLLGFAPAFTAADVYAGTLIGAYEALNAGVTTIVDWCNCTSTPEHADAAVAALTEAGIRAMYAYGTPGGVDWVLEGSRPHPDDARRARAAHFASDDGLLTFALALRGPHGMDPAVVRHDFALARELDARITVHAGLRLPGQTEGDIRPMHEAGLLGPDVTVVHGTEVDDADMTRLADTGTTVSVAPYVELVMGHGGPPITRLLARGLRPSLSMDVATTVPGDMFTQMRAAFAHGRGEQLPADSHERFVPTLSPLDVLRFATVVGAAACGLDGRVGTLAVGTQADLVLVRSDAINTMPGDDPVATVVTAADTSNVDTVLVRGRVVKQDGRLVGVDLPRLRTLGAQARERLMAAVAARTATTPTR